MGAMGEACGGEENMESPSDLIWRGITLGYLTTRGKLLHIYVIHEVFVSWNCCVCT